MTEQPPSRYRVVERGRKLITVDTWAEDGRPDSVTPPPHPPSFDTPREEPSPSSAMSPERIAEIMAIARAKANERAGTDRPAARAYHASDVSDESEDVEEPELANFYEDDVPDPTERETETPDEPIFVGSGRAGPSYSATTGEFRTSPVFDAKGPRTIRLDQRSIGKLKQGVGVAVVGLIVLLIFASYSRFLFFGLIIAFFFMRAQFRRLITRFIDTLER